MANLQKIFESLFGSYNAREVKKFEKYIPQIHEAEEKFKTLSDEDLKKQFLTWKEHLSSNPDDVDGMMVEVFAGIREASRRLIGHKYEVRGKEEEWAMVHYDVQLIGGIVLHQGKIAEMKTGEGKTLVCTLPVILNALSGRGVHLVTVNDYLAQRDAEWMKPLYEFCGLSVGVIVHGVTHTERQEAYNADITYGTNNEFGFDYLRDNMAQSKDQLVQRDLNFAIVDEVDSILVDEARTPLIISAPAEESTDKYLQYARLVPQLKENEHYNIDIKLKAVTLSEAGIAKVESLMGISNLYTEAGFDEVHHIENALKAQVIFEIDRDYVVRDEEVLIVDEFTGRLMPGRRFSDGLHQALEAKEKVEIQRESKTLATITFQNYFRLYTKLAGMTGTAETEAEEFAKIYALDTIVIPTNKPILREDLSDKIFQNERGKFVALAREVEKLNKVGQPVLVGTVSIEKSEALSLALKNAGIPHNVLNAKQHEKEAEIVANAGKKGAVTIATNMAGRGTDIKINDEVKSLGGLAILGTERHESRRIDNQLRGRAGRQGDPGFSQFYVAMTDDLMRRFGGARMASMMGRLGIADDEAVENKIISKSVENAQKKIEAFHFDSRKHVVQYDDVMNVHREKMYGRRREILNSEDISDVLAQMIEGLAQTLAESYCPGPSIDKNADLDGMLETIESMFTIEANAKEKVQNCDRRSDLVEVLTELITQKWGARKKQFPVDQADSITKYVVLRSIDDLWLEHIDAMTHLRDRVSLAGYAQKDPVMEYKREAFLMFKGLLFNVRRTAIANLFRVEVTPDFTMETSDYSDVQTNADQIEGTLSQSDFNTEKKSAETHHRSDNPGKSMVAEKLGKKYENVGRNDLCPCGSGQKFKKCHGKNV
ncbi:preprotein translocase subunit SecA [Candidatus Gracilibacteria bacterium]|nr:preprotein translocase subunit SecA [Candidatus Gracilibacteria bacterium]